MPKENDEVRFGFGIRIIRGEDGRMYCETQSKNYGVQTEVIIMQMKAFLKNLKNDYFDSFNKNSSQFRKED